MSSFAELAIATANEQERAAAEAHRLRVEQQCRDNTVADREWLVAAGFGLPDETAPATASRLPIFDSPAAFRYDTVWVQVWGRERSEGAYVTLTEPCPTKRGAWHRVDSSGAVYRMTTLADLGKALRLHEQRKGTTLGGLRVTCSSCLVADLVYGQVKPKPQRTVADDLVEVYDDLMARVEDAKQAHNDDRAAGLIESAEELHQVLVDAGLLDTASSNSRQYHIDTGRYLTPAEAAEGTSL